MEIENCQIRGPGFTRFTILDGNTWSRRETDKEANDLQTRHFVAKDLERYVGSSTMLENCVYLTSLIQLVNNSRIS